MHSLIGPFFVAVGLLAMVTSLTHAGRPFPGNMEYNLGSSSKPSSGGATVTDMNGDRHPDVVAGSSSGIMYFENDGTGGFQEGKLIIRLYDPPGYGGFAVGDVDGDGIPDIIVTSRDGGRIWVYKGPLFQKKAEEMPSR